MEILASPKLFQITHAGSSIMTGPQSQAPEGAPSLLAKPVVACLIAEVIGNSPISFHDAIDDALSRLLGIVIHGVDIVGQKISFSDVGRNYRVVLKVAYDGALV